MTDAEGHNCFASTIRLEHVRLQVFLAALNKVEILSGDIGTAYLNARTKEKIWTTLGVEFGDKEGMNAEVVKALYGLKTSGNAFYMHLCDAMKKLGFSQSKLDPALWFRLRKDQKGYDYFSHHEDDFLVSGRNQSNVIKTLKNIILL